MWNFNEVTFIEYQRDYTYHIKFDNGLEGDVDFSGYIDIGPVFAPLRELSYFKKAKIGGGTISWPNGADIAPETLYEEVEKSNIKIEAAR